MQEALKVGVSEFPPLVMREGDTFKGFEIDLWEKVAALSGLTYTYVPTRFQNLIDDLKDKKLDVGIAGLTLTEEREEHIDFSHSTFNSGLHILVPSRLKTSAWSAVRSIFSKEIGHMLLFVIGFMILAAHIIWFAEHTGTGPLSGPYWPGIFNAFWWALETVSTIGYGDFVPVTFIGKIAGMFIILSGLAIFGLYIGQVSSSITLRRLQSDISSPEDLAGKRVGTVRKSVSEDALNKIGAQVMGFDTIDDSYEALGDGRIDAVVFDAPVLSLYARTRGRGKVSVVGDVFEKQNYGFGLQEGSQLSESINRAILNLYESGDYANIYKKWFGENY